MARSPIPALAAPLGLAALATPAQADEARAMMAVSVEIAGSCSVSAAPMAFAPAAGQPDSANAQTHLALACTPGTAFDVALDTGQHADGTVRRMRDAVSGAYVAYDIYSDAGRTTRWGSRAGIDTVAGRAGPGGAVQLAAYGAILADGALPSGSYADALVITVNF